MIRALILYYLSLKATHGYEIQKFIQLNQMDSWTKIQSGSIYYALSKLEKEGHIALFKEENVGAKVRKIYKITEQGKEELSKCVQEELGRELYDIGSDKFIIYPILNGTDKASIIIELQKHIALLYEKKKYIEKWQGIKVGGDTLRIEELCFEMMLSSLDYQIKWHEMLIQDLDECIASSRQISEIIKRVDFSAVNDMEEIMKDLQTGDVERLRQEILDNPECAEEKLEELIRLMKK